MRRMELTAAHNARPGWSVLIFALVLGALAAAYQAAALALNTPATDLYEGVVLISAALAGVVGGVLGWWALVAATRAPGALMGALAGLLSVIIASVVFATGMLTIFSMVRPVVAPTDPLTVPAHTMG